MVFSCAVAASSLLVSSPAGAAVSLETYQLSGVTFSDGGTATGWFEAGFVTYSNQSKSELLDVPAALIAQLGSVSEEVAAEMARGALANTVADVAISTTGIAGPTGAVPGKPVGTVCFGWSRGDSTHTERLVFQGDRQAVREQTVAHALRGLLRFVE